MFDIDKIMTLSIIMKYTDTQYVPAQNVYVL